MAKARSPKWVPFDSNGYAKSYTPKTKDTNSKQHLKRLKDVMGKKNNRGGKI